MLQLKLLSFPGLTFLYSAVLCIFGALTLLLYSLCRTQFGWGVVPMDIGDNMFIYLTTIVGWLVTTRPAHALSVNESLTSGMRRILIDLQQLGNEEMLRLVIYALTGVVPRNLSKAGKKIITKHETLQMQQTLALPARLHALCVALVLVFHGVVVPLLLYDQNAWYCLLPNFLLGVYTTGCLVVAEDISQPYCNLRGSNEAVQYFQTQVHVLLKKTRTINLKSPVSEITLLLQEIEKLELPNPLKEPVAHPCKSWA